LYCSPGILVEFPDIKIPTINTVKLAKIDIYMIMSAIVNLLVLALSRFPPFYPPAFADVAAMNTHHLYRSKVSAKNKNISFIVSKLFAMQSEMLELKKP
jgi:hypothetical protein